MVTAAPKEVSVATILTIGSNFSSRDIATYFFDENEEYSTVRGLLYQYVETGTAYNFTDTETFNKLLAMSVDELRKEKKRLCKAKFDNYSDFYKLETVVNALLIVRAADTDLWNTATIKDSKMKVADWKVCANDFVNTAKPSENYMVEGNRILQRVTPFEIISEVLNIQDCWCVVDTVNHFVFDN